MDCYYGFQDEIDCGTIKQIYENYKKLNVRQ